VSTDEIAAAAARLVVDDGMEYGEAKRKAARAFGRRAELPGNEQVEDEVRAYIEVFCAEEQAAELAALRRLARRWMQRLATFRPHLAGAAWRGTATRRSALHLDLYCDDAKATELALVNAGVRFDGGHLQRAGAEPLPVLTLAEHCEELGDTVTLHLSVHDFDDLRGALKPDARGRTWRGDLVALDRLLGAAEEAAR
jgi:hypothetical protein